MTTRLNLAAFALWLMISGTLAASGAAAQQRPQPERSPDMAPTPPANESSGSSSALEIAGQPGDPFATRITVSALVAYALAHNPEIQAAEKRYEAAKARPSQAGTLPDPMIEAAYHNEKITALTLGQSDFSFLQFGAAQEVPFPGKLSLREEIATREAERERQALRATKLGVTSRLTVAYADLVFVDQALDILQRNKHFLEDLQKAAETRYQVGSGIQQDVVKAQVEVSLVTSRLLQLESRREGLKATLNALLNRPPLGPLGVLDPIPGSRLALTLDQLRELALENSPAVKGANTTIAREELNLSLARREYYPDFVLKADYYHKAALLPEWEVGLGVKIPLYFWRKQRYGVEEAAAGVDEARSSRQNVTETLLAGVKDLYVQAQTAEKLAALYQTTIIPQSRVSIESASAGYGVGRVDFLTLLNNVIVLREAEVSYQEQSGEFQKSVAQLEEIVGTSLR